MSEPEPYSVPIIPGYQATPAAVVIPPPKRPARRRRWLVSVAIGAVVVALAASAYAFLAFRSPRLLPAAVSPERPLATAWHTCGGTGELSDGDRTLFLDMAGEKDTSGLTASQIRCVLDQLKTPDYIIKEMEQTRAIDGRQTDHWGTFEASWTYHPDAGLDLLIRER